MCPCPRSMQIRVATAGKSTFGHISANAINAQGVLTHIFRIKSIETMPEVNYVCRLDLQSNCNVALTELRDIFEGNYFRIMTGMVAETNSGLSYRLAEPEGINFKAVW